MSDELTQAVRALANLRRDYDKVHAELVATQKEAFEGYKSLVHLDEIAKQERDEMEAEVRRLQLEAPAALVDGVAVVNGSEVQEYPEASAIAWCVEHKLPQILRLDRKAYEAVALALGIIKKHNVLKVRIASDLSVYLEETTE